jgi:hypothetical protein
MLNHEVMEIVAGSNAADDCGGGTLSSLLLRLAKGEVTPSDLSEDCVQALENWVEKTQESVESMVLWSHFSLALAEARDRYNHCLHEEKAGIPMD